MITRYDIRLNNDRIPMLIKDMEVTYNEDKKINSPAKVESQMMEIFEHEEMAQRDLETVLILCLDYTCKLIGYFKVATGSGCMCIVTPRDLYRRAIACGASQIIMVHNHPSGETHPSNPDLDIKDKLKKCGDVLGISLADFIITGYKSGELVFNSFKQSGLL